jgi:hypothetical protein
VSASEILLTTSYSERSTDNYEDITLVVLNQEHEDLRHDGSARNPASHALWQECAHFGIERFEEEGMTLYLWFVGNSNEIM